MIDSRAIEKARAFPIEVVAREHGLTLKAKGHVERVGPCPRCGGTDRFSINIRKRVFNCRGCQQGGDVIALMQFLTGCNFREAVTSLAGEQTTTKTHVQEPGKSPLKSCAFSVPEAEQQPNDYEARQLEKAKWLRRRSQPATGTPVATYLRGRLNGITKPLPPTIRYLAPRKPSHHHAMLVPYGLRKVCAVQLTLLKPDGSDKADIESNKITIASPAGMPMVIAPPNDLLGLAICEGVEDALSVHYATGLGAWASGGASNMPKLAPAVPHHIEAVTIYAHDDESGQRNAQQLAEALDVRGIEIRVEGLTPCHA